MATPKVLRPHWRAHAVAAIGDVRGGGDDGRGLPPVGGARQLCVGDPAHLFAPLLWSKNADVDLGL